MATQEEAIRAIDSGENVFLSGGAGVGKSHVIGQAVNDRTVLMAPTGVAALNIGGETCHSTFGLPTGLVTEEDLEKRSKRFSLLFSGNFVERLIIDEISMLRADYLDAIDYKLKKIRKNDKPFGGLQTIVVGDFFQLPPILQRAEKSYFEQVYENPYAFSSEVWKKANFDSKVLTKVYRQSDEEQISVLNDIRTKTLQWRKSVEKLNDWCRGGTEEEQLTLCNYIEDADRINNKHYSQIKREEFTYTAQVKGKFKANDCMVDAIINLKEGCKIVLCANDPSEEKSYRNGQRAIITDLCDDYICATVEETGFDIEIERYTWERLKYSNGVKGLTKVVEGSFTQFPVRLGWAVTVHKAQGLTLDNCAINLGRESFAFHQTYVALSRIRDLKNINLIRPITNKDIKVDPIVKKFYKELM